MSHPPSRFVWYELMTSDAAAARAFYTQVVGWQASDSGMPGMDYTLLSAGDRQVAGMMDLPAELRAAGVPPHWIGYLAVADVDASAAALQQAGGAVHRPASDIPGVGRFAVVADPAGAAYCLFKDNKPDTLAPLPPGTQGHVDWHELMGGPLDTAWAFYSGLFGWTKDEAMDMGPMGIYQMFKSGDTTIGGMMTRPPEMPVAAWNYYVNVDAIDAAAARVLAGGGKVVNGPMEVPGGSWVLNAMDPQGAMFSLVAAKR